jgi:transposase
MDDTLFELPPTEPDEHEGAAGVPRLQLPNRSQLEFRSVDLDGLLGADHRARLVWAFVEGLDLTPLYARIKAIEGHRGRPPIDPAILVALWLYATLEGVGSARALDRLCGQHDAYRWLAGGVGLNYHTLAAFRVENADVLDRLLTQSVAALLADGLVTLERVAQDGIRVRAAAGAASYRRRPSLERFLAQATAHVAALKAEVDADPAASSRRVAAARERAVRERAERVRHALAHLPEIEATKKRNTKRGKLAPEARTSTTDPQARVMKMADGGWRPAYNAQFVTDTGSQVIIGLGVTPIGNDQGQLGPMVRQLHARYGRAPGAWLADAGFLSNSEIDEFGSPSCGTALYLPVRSPEAQGRDPYLPLPGDSAAIASWRARMGTPEAKEIYKDRAATAECVNALARNRGLQRFGVRGREKARAVLLWFALAHNLMRTTTLRSAASAV